MVGDFTVFYARFSFFQNSTYRVSRESLRVPRMSNGQSYLPLSASQRVSYNSRLRRIHSAPSSPADTSPWTLAGRRPGTNKCLQLENKYTVS